MKKALKVIASLIFMAAFVYGAYSWFYEFRHLNLNTMLLFLNGLLICASFGFCCGISQSSSKKNSKKRIAAVSIVAFLASAVVMTGLCYLIYNIILGESDTIRAAKYVLIVMFTALVGIFISLLVRTFNSKAIKITVSVVLTVATLVSNFYFIWPYVNIKYKLPFFRPEIGGIQTECENIKYTFARSTEKIKPSDTLNAMTDIDICLAKNEREGFQIAVVSTEKKESVSISVTDFKNENGDTIQVELFKEHYVDVYYPLNEMWHVYPDALMPIKQGEKAELTKDFAQTFYIEARSSAKTPAGEYTATLTLKDADGEVAIEKEINATVWDFALPETRYTETAFGVWDEAITGEEYKKYYDYLLDHGISAYNLPYDILDDRADAYMSDPRVTSFRIPYYADDEELVKVYEKVSSNPVWARKGYFYPIDEPNSLEDFEAYNIIAERLERLCPGYNMVTPFGMDVPDGATINPFELQKEKNTILCPIAHGHMDEAFHEEVEALVSQGTRSWWYVCGGSSENELNMPIRFNGLNHRLLFWQQYDYDITGFLYWGTAYWNLCKNPWLCAKSFDIWETAGDGTMLYPGEYIGVDGPVGSLRLKNVSAGLDDYDYLNMAEEQFGEEWVNDEINKVITALDEFTSDAELFEQVRREIGARLSSK